MHLLYLRIQEAANMVFQDLRQRIQHRSLGFSSSDLFTILPAFLSYLGNSFDPPSPCYPASSLEKRTITKAKAIKVPTTMPWVMSLKMEVKIINQITKRPLLCSEKSFWAYIFIPMKKEVSCIAFQPETKGGGAKRVLESVHLLLGQTVIHAMMLYLESPWGFFVTRSFIISSVLLFLLGKTLWRPGQREAKPRSIEAVLSPRRPNPLASRRPSASTVRPKGILSV